MEDPLVKLLLDWPKTITYSKREAGYSYYNSLPSGKQTHSRENDQFGRMTLEFKFGKTEEIEED